MLMDLELNKLEEINRQNRNSIVWCGDFNAHNALRSQKMKSICVYMMEIKQGTILLPEGNLHFLL